jgi:argininosuccinate lyase
MLDTLSIRRERCLAAAKGGYSNATDLADYLVGKGVPFREAHEQVGAVVRSGLSMGLAIEDLPLAVIKGHAPAATDDVFAYIDITAGFARRSVKGATGPVPVATALQNVT